MSILETVATVQDQILDAIKAGQDAVLSAVDTLADSATPITENLPAAPFAEHLPKPVDVIDNYFSFAQKLLASQKDFTLKLVESYSPAKTVSKPAPKAAAKAA
ncbi:MAG TPA: hypothetical protein VLL25_16665 [Acidimicrobiales bacterium]|nr:hypothetical protein [Acidimicrobiales bacterium]